MVFARLAGAHQAAHRFLVETFTTLEFDERAALEAARVGAAFPPAKGTKQGIRDLWHRDIAILGTASVHELDAVITANSADFLPFQDWVSCTIHVVTPVRLRGAKSGAKSSWNRDDARRSAESILSAGAPKHLVALLEQVAART